MAASDAQPCSKGSRTDSWRGEMLLPSAETLPRRMSSLSARAATKDVLHSPPRLQSIATLPSQESWLTCTDERRVTQSLKQLLLVHNKAHGPRSSSVVPSLGHRIMQPKAACRRTWLLEVQKRRAGPIHSTDVIAECTAPTDSPTRTFRVALTRSSL